MPLSLLVMDLDGFKEITTRSVTAPVTCSSAKSRSGSRPTCARPTRSRAWAATSSRSSPGADEGGAGHVAQKIIGASATFDIEGTAHEIASRSGSRAPGTGRRRDADAPRGHGHVRREADPGRVCRLTPATGSRGLESLALMADLRHTLDTTSCRLSIRIVGFSEGELVRVEALARWRHPTRGLIAPGEFIPLAERSGLVKSLFSRCARVDARAVCRMEAGQRSLQAAVNLSIRNLLDPEPPRGPRALDAAGIPPSGSRSRSPRRCSWRAEPRDADPRGAPRPRRQLAIATSAWIQLARVPAAPPGVRREDRPARYVGRMTRDRGSAEIVKLITNLGHALG